MEERQSLWIKRAIVPALFFAVLFGVIAFVIKKNISIAVLFAVIGLPVGYVVANAGKW